MKIKTQYACQNCGYTTAKWLGRCAGCDAWNTMVEERGSNAPQATNESNISAVREEFKGLRDAGLEQAGVHGAWVVNASAEPWVTLDAEEGDDDKTPARQPMKRISTGISELDRVLGGGLVQDSFILLGGDPGIGKSTLLLQMAKGLLGQPEKPRMLYVSGEESIDQIRGRARRLGVVGKDQVYLAAETQLEKVFATIKELKPDVLVMDSLQTFSSGFIQSAPGSVGQLREVAARLMALAKSARIAVFIVGHVTKEGSIAGPKVVEHMVDTVLYFEGEGGQTYRLLRAVKNRFGNTHELGVFEMEGEGLREVSNPSSLFLNERREPVPGVAVATSLEGTRPLLVEVQALVAPSGLAVPRRTSVGIESSRIALLGAILERHMELSLAQSDLFFNVAGGLKLSEPACDLAAAAAIWSSNEEYPIPSEWVFIGELGLTGEVRRVAQLEIRIQEAKKLGFKTIILPENTPAAILDKYGKESGKNGIRIKTIGRINQLPKLLT